MLVMGKAREEPLGQEQMVGYGGYVTDGMHQWNCTDMLEEVAAGRGLRSKTEVVYEDVGVSVSWDGATVKKAAAEGPCVTTG